VKGILESPSPGFLRLAPDEVLIVRRLALEIEVVEKYRNQEDD
jgi:hypothetical protein